MNEWIQRALAKSTYVDRHTQMDRGSWHCSFPLMGGWMDKYKSDSADHNQAMWVNHKCMWVLAVVVKVEGGGCGPIFSTCLLESSAGRCPK